MNSTLKSSNHSTDPYFMTYLLFPITLEVQAEATIQLIAETQSQENGTILMIVPYRK